MKALSDLVSAGAILLQTVTNDNLLVEACFKQKYSVALF
jgi:hypothetical protein